jgi:hypothetical protein
MPWGFFLWERDARRRLNSRVADTRLVDGLHGRLLILPPAGPAVPLAWYLHSFHGARTRPDTAIPAKRRRVGCPSLAPPEATEPGTSPACRAIDSTQRPGIRPMPASRPSGQASALPRRRVGLRPGRDWLQRPDDDRKAGHDLSVVRRGERNNMAAVILIVRAKTVNLKLMPIRVLRLGGYSNDRSSFSA